MHFTARDITVFTQMLDRPTSKSVPNHCFELSWKYRVAWSRLTHFKFEYCAGAIACRGWREGWTVEDRTPFHTVSRNWAVGTCNNVLPVFVVSATSLGLLSRPTSLHQIFSYGGVPERTCVTEAYHDYSRTQTCLCWQSCAYWWGPTEAHVQQLPDMLATGIDVNGDHLPDVQIISL